MCCDVLRRKCSSQHAVFKRMPACAVRVPSVQDPSLAEALYYMGLFNLASASGPSAVVAATAPLKENLRQLVSALGESALLCCVYTLRGDR